MSHPHSPAAPAQPNVPPDLATVAEALQQTVQALLAMHHATPQPSTPRNAPDELRVYQLSEKTVEAERQMLKEFDAPNWQYMKLSQNEDFCSPARKASSG